ncbi:MAG TPA: hypothetical protein VFV91_04455 [Gaiellaceae bacterium]|nr:hypothetical protein [Gaiellaceae bacterium]
MTPEDASRNLWSDEAAGTHSWYRRRSHGLWRKLKVSVHDVVGDDHDHEDRVVTTQTSGPTSIILRFVDPSENSLYIQMSGQSGLIRVVREAVIQRLNPFPDFKGHRMGWTVSPIARGPKDCTRTLRIRTALRGLAPGEYFKKYAGQKIKLVMYGGAVPGAPGRSSFPKDMFCHHTLFALQSL